MKVSVIVLTFNRAHMLAQAIESVLRQTFRDFELIIVDNYSSDNTESLVKSYDDERLKYFKNQNNGFIGINRNFGIENSSGEYIAFLDDDDLWLPEKLEQQVELLNSNRELGFIYSDCYLIDSNGKLGEYTYFRRWKPVRGRVFNALLQNNPIPMLTVMIVKEVLKKVGLFNPDYRIALDYDLWLRVAEHYPIDFTKQPLAKYRVHGESGYQQNTALAYREDLQIMDWWLNSKKTSIRQSVSKIRQTKINLYQTLISYYLMNHKKKEAFREAANLTSLLPFSLRVLPSIIACVGRSFKG